MTLGPSANGTRRLLAPSACMSQISLRQTLKPSRLASRMNAMVRPSGDHAGIDSLLDEAVRRRRWLPFASIVQMSPWRTKAICPEEAPLACAATETPASGDKGDQVGSMLLVTPSGSAGAA